jgi:hypothetical protein
MSKSRSSAGEKKLSAERVILWIGAICGILVSSYTLFEKLTAPTEPRLVVTFFESSSDILNLSPSTDTSIEQTEEIPLQLKIENTGGRVAKNAKLYLSHYPDVVLTSHYKKEEKYTWNTPNEAMKQLSLMLEDINPGESFLIPISLRIDFPKDFQQAVSSPRERVKNKDLLVPREHHIYCDLSSDTSPNKRITLKIVLGNLEVLRERTQDVFWLGHGEGGVRVLKAKEDFPSR